VCIAHWEKTMYNYKYNLLKLVYIKNIKIEHIKAFIAAQKPRIGIRNTINDSWKVFIDARKEILVSKIIIYINL